MNTAFDTLKAAKRLKDAGLEETQAEALVEVISSTVTENLATTEALALLEERLGGEIQSVRQELGGEIQSVRQELGSKIAAVEQRLGRDLYWMKAIGGVIVALLAVPLLREFIQAL